MENEIMELGNNYVDDVTYEVSDGFNKGKLALGVGIGAALTALGIITVKKVKAFVEKKRASKEAEGQIVVDENDEVIG